MAALMFIAATLHAALIGVLSARMIKVAGLIVIMFILIASSVVVRLTGLSENPTVLQMLAALAAMQVGYLAGSFIFTRGPAFQSGAGHDPSGEQNFGRLPNGPTWPSVPESPQKRWNQ